MIESLTAAQLTLLRRCHGGLRLFETGAPLKALLDDLAVLDRLELVVRDETRGYELTPQGERCLIRLENRGR